MFIIEILQKQFNQTMKNILTNLLLSVILLTFTSFSIFAQSSKISGTIKSNDGKPIVGVSIVVKGTSKGTTSDVNGSFSLEVNQNNTLIFSSVGFLNKEVNVKGQSNLNITLDENNKDLDEIIVTGVFDKRTKMESSVAISTLNSKQMSVLAVTSAADLLRNIPGVYVNNSRGEIANTVYSRGISANSIDNASGYYYVSMQEDGLPLMNVNFGTDNYLRADITTERLEAVRGGTASILGANAPGGIFNYVSKTGGRTTQGEIRARYGLEGDGKNPFYRMDANVGGPLSKDPAALNRQGFTKDYIAANPNAVYSTQGSMPRAYFLTMSYKF
jgi:iron complex outermembrane recepter protein